MPNMGIAMLFFADIKAIRAIVTDGIDSLGDRWLVVYEYVYWDEVPAPGGQRYWHCEFKMTPSGMSQLYSTCEYYALHPECEFLPHLVSVVRVSCEAHSEYTTTEIKKFTRDI